MDARKWKRSFMNAEHEHRRMRRKMEVEMFDLEISEMGSRQEIRLLREQIKRDKFTIKGQHGIIRRLQKLLRDKGIAEPFDTQVISFKTCKANDNEICPLSLQPINFSAPPYDAKHPSIVIDLHKPNNKCVELECGHRFNGLWLLFHFVARSTSRCPLCRSGHEDFQFEMRQMPAGLVDRVREIMEKKK
jgi:hypothetical protein